MNTTLASLRQTMAERQDDFFSSSTTGGGSSTTLVDTGLANLPGGGDDDFCIGWYVLITEDCDTSEDEVRRVSSYDECTNTITVEQAFSGSIGSSVAYELHRYDPRIKNRAIQRALVSLFPTLYLHVVDESLVTDNLLSNTGFETFSGGFTGWTEVGSPTVTQETTIVRHGSSAAKVVADACNDGQLTQTPTPSVDEITGKSVTHKRWVYATAGSTARLLVDFGSCDTEASDYHSGADQWELLSVTAAVPDDATQVQAVCEVAAGGTGYFDIGGMLIDPLYRYDLPSSIIEGPHFVSQQWNELDPSGPYYKIVSPPNSNRILRVEGMNHLTVPTTDSGTTEVSEPQVELVVTEALRHFSMMMMARSSTQDRARWREDMQMWAQEVQLLKVAGLAMFPMAAEFPRGMSPPQWHIEHEGETKVLVFDRKRVGSDTSRFSTL